MRTGQGIAAVMDDRMAERSSLRIRLVAYRKEAGLSVLSDAGG